MNATAVDTTPDLGWQDLDEEVALDAIDVSGELPPWLVGSLVRVTPAKWEVDGIRHWFDGLAMLHRFGIADGRVSYANSFLRGRSYEEVERTGRLSQGFATDPCRAIFKRIQTIFSGEMPDNCNVNVARIGERYVAMTETPIPVEFDPKTLATMGHAPEAPGQVTTAHPHHDRTRGEAINYAVRFGPRTAYRVYAQPADGGESRLLAEIPAKEPAYMHSFGMPERFVVLAEFPLVVNPMKLALSAHAFIENYRWKPERGTRFLVIDRSDGTVRMKATAEPFFCFHHVNAFEEGDEVVVDLIAYEDPKIIQALYLDAMRAPDARI